MCSYLPNVDYFNTFVKKEFVECVFLIFSFDLLLYPSVLIKGSLDNAVNWLSHRSGKGDVFVFILAYLSIFCGVFNKIVITLALVAYGMIMTNAVPGVS